MGVKLANKAKMHKATAVALMSIMTITEVMNLSGYSKSQLYRLKSGKHPIAHLPSDLDREFIESLGLKICACCQVKLVPTKPVRGHILTSLCESCWSSTFAEENMLVSSGTDLTEGVIESLHYRTVEDLEAEVWVGIENFPAFQVSNYGRVYDIDNDRLVYLNITYRRELAVALQDEGGQLHSKDVHLLVLEAFVGPRPNNHVHSHMNGVPSDNTKENLQWMMPSDKLYHAWEIGLFDKKRKFELQLEGKPYGSSQD
jgi:hypothetical protein